MYVLPPHRKIVHARRNEKLAFSLLFQQTPRRRLIWADSLRLPSWTPCCQWLQSIKMCFCTCLSMPGQLALVETMLRHSLHDLIRWTVLVRTLVPPQTSRLLLTNSFFSHSCFVLRIPGEDNFWLKNTLCIYNGKYSGQINDCWLSLGVNFISWYRLVVNRWLNNYSYKLLCNHWSQASWASINYRLGKTFIWVGKRCCCSGIHKKVFHF